MKKVIISALTIITFTASIGLADVGTAFNYQGRFKDGSNWASGTYNFEFRVYDALTGGTQQGTEDTVTAVDVADGYFSASIDCGTGVFAGNPRWLEIAVDGGSGYTTLYPRQELKPAPYAMYSANGSGGGSYPSIHEVDSKVGIGTTNPAGKLDVSGYPFYNYAPQGILSEYMQAKSIRFGQTGFQGGSIEAAAVNELKVTAGSTHTPNCFLSFYTQNNYALGEKVRIDSTGNVGIGTTNPSFQLQVEATPNTGTDGIGIFASNAAAGQWVNFEMGQSNASYKAAILRYFNGDGIAANSRLAIFNAGEADSDAINVVGGGNVGIGTTSPTQKLDINGNIRVSGTNGFISLDGAGANSPPTGLGYGMFPHNNVGLGIHSVNGQTSFWGGGTPTEYMRLANGNLGIGTTNPQDALTFGEEDKVIRFNGSNTPTGTYGRIRAFNTVYNFPTAEIVFGRATGNGGHIEFWTGLAASMAEQMRIRHDGRVGIGTTDPQCKLDVNGNIRCVALTETSDDRLKANVQPLTGALDKLDGIRGVSYQWNEKAQDAGAEVGSADIGVLAQDVEKVFPELVSCPEGGYKSVDYSKLTAVLIEAVKELKNENENLKERLSRLDQLEARLVELESK